MSSERMSEEEFEKKARWVDGHSTHSDSAFVAEARRARAAEERLTKALEDAPHGADCEEGEPEAFRKGRIVSRASCNCWKSRALRPTQ